MAVLMDSKAFRATTGKGIDEATVAYMTRKRETTMAQLSADLRVTRTVAKRVLNRGVRTGAWTLDGDVYRATKPVSRDSHYAMMGKTPPKAKPAAKPAPKTRKAPVAKPAAKPAPKTRKAAPKTRKAAPKTRKAPVAKPAAKPAPKARVAREDAPKVTPVARKTRERKVADTAGRAKTREFNRTWGKVQLADKAWDGFGDHPEIYNPDTVEIVTREMREDRKVRDEQISRELNPQVAVTRAEFDALAAKVDAQTQAMEALAQAVALLAQAK